MTNKNLRQRKRMNFDKEQTSLAWRTGSLPTRFSPTECSTGDQSTPGERSVRTPSRVATWRWMGRNIRTPTTCPQQDNRSSGWI